MNSTVNVIINVLIMTIPYRFLSYCPMWNNVRVKKLAAILLISFSELIFILIALFFSEHDISVENAEYIYSALCFAIYSFCVDIKIYKTIFFYLFTVEYALIVRGISAFITFNLLPGEARGFYSWQSCLIQLIIFLAALPFIIVFFRKTAERILDSEESVILKAIWAVPLLTILVIFIFTGSMEAESSGRLDFLTARTALLICTFIVYYILLKYLDMYKENAVLKEREEQARAINDLQRTQYKLMQKRIEETRIARHDLRQHFNMIQAYIDSGNNEALEEYLEAYKNNLPIDTSKAYCRNYAIDVIIRYYATRAEGIEANFTAELDFPEKIAVSEPDICVILGNLIENAVEACERQTHGRRFIRVCGKIIGESAVSLTVDNSCDEKVEASDGVFLSSKTNEAGTGLLSVKNIAEKYNGITDFRYRDGIFYASVLLNP